ncbi:hypothetical protein [Pantoea agglomerans]|uniref:hypothetical protein n=1 Tax=Enterobacter agglomerans TaxID=549 RepID=UPI002413164C|nr:hypothetical protein [Pantoea agglomerans]
MRKTETFKTGCTMVIGQTGCGKTALQAQIMHLFLARSDVSQIRDVYTDVDRERLAAAIRQNTCIWYSLNSGDEHHES